jgi:hypothetical protein
MNIEQIAAERYPDLPREKNFGTSDDFTHNQIAFLERQSFISGYHYAQQQRRWIPVTERLPTREDANYYEYVEVVWDNGYDCREHYLDVGRKAITHWRTPEKVEI